MATLPVFLEPEAVVVTVLPDGLSSLGTSFCISAWPNSQPGGRLLGRDMWCYRVIEDFMIKIKGKEQETHLLGVQRDSSTVLSHTREQ